MRSALKRKVLGLAVLETLKIRQRSRQTWLKHGDVNSKFFHIKANSRRRKNYINALQTPTGMAVTKEQKEEELTRYFSQRLGLPSQRQACINWARLDLPEVDLTDLEEPFSEEELIMVIKETPSEKSPGPDGFIGAFFKKTWDITKLDLMETVTHFGNLNSERLQDLNTANICLIPKKSETLRVEDFRPISLIHSFSKMLAKLMANRLAPKLNDLVSQNQNAFIRKRAIHDNFLHVQNMVKLLHKRKKPSLFIKVDISKAFDSVSWPYMIEVLQNFGFGQRWCNWVSNLLGNSSSRILLNGIPGDYIFHARGLRQGDPLSPMLFILAMEPLQKLIKGAEEAGIFSNLFQGRRRFRCSLYADDVAIFIKPDQLELQALKKILNAFGDCSGLHINLQKTDFSNKLQ